MPLEGSLVGPAEPRTRLVAAETAQLKAGTVCESMIINDPALLATRQMRDKRNELVISDSVPHDLAASRPHPLRSSWADHAAHAGSATSEDAANSPSTLIAFPAERPQTAGCSNALAIHLADASLDCWGAEVRGSSNACVPGFLAPPHSRFKKRFCSQCQQGVFDIPAERVLSLPPPILQAYANTTNRSFWTQGARVVNQTARCNAPKLLIFEAVPPREVVETALALPAAMLQRRANGSSFVRFVLMNGTLVPQAAGAPPPVRHSVATHTSTPASSSASTSCTLAQLSSAFLPSMPLASAGPSSASTLSARPPAAMTQPSSVFRHSMSLAVVGPVRTPIRGAPDLDGASTCGTSAPVMSNAIELPPAHIVQLAINDADSSNGCCGAEVRGSCNGPTVIRQGHSPVAGVASGGGSTYSLLESSTAVPESESACWPPLGMAEPAGAAADGVATATASSHAPRTTVAAPTRMAASRPRTLTPSETSCDEPIDEVGLEALFDSDPTIEGGFVDRRSSLGFGSSSFAVVATCKPFPALESLLGAPIAGPESTISACGPLLKRPRGARKPSGASRDRGGR